MRMKNMLFKAVVNAAPLALLACCSKALATDTIQDGYFSVPAPPARQGWPYTAPAQLFQPSTTSDTTTTNPLNLANPASVMGSGLNPNYLSSPFLNNGIGSTIGGANPFINYGNSYGTSFNSYSGFPFIGAVTSHVPYVGSYVGLPFVGGGLTHGWGVIGHGFGGWGGGYSPFNSFGSFAHNAFGYNGFNYGGWNYGGFGYGGLGYGGIGNPASFMGSAHQATVPNSVIQTRPSPSAGNYYQPATTDSSASGGYYASTGSAQTYQAAPTKHQPKSYYGSSDSDNWGSSGNPFPKDLNSVPWAK